MRMKVAIIQITSLYFDVKYALEKFVILIIIKHAIRFTPLNSLTAFSLITSIAIRY